MSEYYVLMIPEQLSETNQATLNIRLASLNGSSKDIKAETGQDLIVHLSNEQDLQKFCQLQTLQAQETKKETTHSTETEETSQKYVAIEPLYSFETLVVSATVKEELISAIDLFRVEQTVFDEWGLRTIEPNPRTALNFYGPPGTGKTLSAHALAQRISKKILVASYAEIESKYHGDGPKNVKAIFQSAQDADAVLFIDEADSLLSKRLTNVTQGSEQAINSMRSQLLICLEQFRGTVIFSTNLVENYDKAFETRVRHIEFSLPDLECRKKIWNIHLPEKLPKDQSVDLDALAQIDDICGRDIKNAVIDAATRAAIKGQKQVCYQDLWAAIERIKKARIKESPQMKVLEGEEKKQMEEKLRTALGKQT